MVFFRWQCTKCKDCFQDHKSASVHLNRNNKRCHATGSITRLTIGAGAVGAEMGAVTNVTDVASLFGGAAAQGNQEEVPEQDHQAGPAGGVPILDHEDPENLPEADQLGDLLPEEYNELYGAQANAPPQDPEVPDSSSSDADFHPTSISENSQSSSETSDSSSDSSNSSRSVPIEDLTNAIRFWEDLVSYNGPDGISPDLLRRSRDISTPAEFSDPQNRRPTVEDDDEPQPSAADLYDHPLMQKIHEFILESKLSTIQGDDLLNLWTESHDIASEVKPTVKNLNSRLLKFVQGSEILEKNMGDPTFDKTQKLKLVYKDIMGLIEKILKNPELKENLHYESKIERVDPDDPDSERVFSDMHTGVWMQKAHLVVGETRTPIGIVLYSDKTHALQGMQCYPIYMSLVNLDNKIRFTNAGWQLVGLLPIPSKKAGNYKGKMNFVTRKTKLFHDCIEVIMESVNKAYTEGKEVKCSDGFTRNIAPLVAAWLGDREEHELIASVVKSNCQTCEVDKEDLDDLEPHNIRSALKVAETILEAREQGIFPGWQDEPGAGNIPRPIFKLSGLPPRQIFDQKRVERAETALGLKLSQNATWLFPSFDCYIQTPDDPMHNVNLGLWVHLLTAVFFDLQKFLETAKKRGGSSYFGPKKQETVWNRLRDRLTDIDLGKSGFTVDKHVGAIAQTVLGTIKNPKKSTLGLKATEHYLLMLALPFLMENLIEDEIEEIRELIKKNPSVAAQFPNGVEDPCPKYCDIMEDFVSWYFKARKTRQTEASIFEVAQLGLRLQKKLKETFPERAGRASGWSFPKFHAMRHIPRLLVMFGCWENVSTQSGEMAHKAHVKEAMFSTNRKDWEVQIMSVHARMDAMVHHKRQMLDEVAELEVVSDALQDWVRMNSKKEERNEKIENRLGSSKGIKYELEKSWTDHKKLRRQLTSGGIKGKKQQIDLVSLSREDYVFRESHPALIRLQKCLCDYIVQFHGEFLEPQLESRLKRKLAQGHKIDIRDINAVLSSAVKGGKITAWNQLTMWHKGDIEGVQRIRSYPFRKTKNFEGRTFHGKNQQDIVALVPKEVNVEDFKYEGSVSGKIDVAQVQLFFEFEIERYKSEDEEQLQDCNDEERKKVQAAFVSYYAPFADSRNRPLFKPATTGSNATPRTVVRDMWTSRGYEILYETSEPDGPHFDVVSLESVLGICPIIRLYRNQNGTVPAWAVNQKAQAYPVGRISTKNNPGSATYIVNNLGLKYSR